MVPWVPIHLGSKSLILAYIIQICFHAGQKALSSGHTNPNMPGLAIDASVKSNFKLHISRPSWETPTNLHFSYVQCLYVIHPYTTACIDILVQTRTGKLLKLICMCDLGIRPLEQLKQHNPCTHALEMVFILYLHTGYAL